MRIFCLPSGDNYENSCSHSKPERKIVDKTINSGYNQNIKLNSL